MLVAANAMAADPDHVDDKPTKAPRVEMSLGTSVHDLRTYGVTTNESTYPLPIMPTIDMRVSFPHTFLASGVGVRGTWVLPFIGNPSVGIVDAYYSFGLRPQRLRGVTSSLTIDVGPSVASVAGSDSGLFTHAYAAHVDIGAVASLAFSVHVSSFFARLSGGYRAGLSTCGSCGVQWDGDAFASLDIGFALDVPPAH
jgi:hypothetical protein